MEAKPNPTEEAGADQKDRRNRVHNLSIPDYRRRNSGA